MLHEWTSPYAEKTRAVWRYGEVRNRDLLPRVDLDIKHICPQLHLAHRIMLGSPRAPAGTHPSFTRVIVDCELILNIAGNGLLEFEDQAIAVHSHQLLFIPPFVPHRFVFGSDVFTDHIAVHFDFIPKMPKVAAALKERDPYQLQLPPELSLPRSVALPPGHCIQVALIDLADQVENASPTVALVAIHHLCGILLDANALGHQSAVGPYPATVSSAKVLRAISYIHDHLTEPLTLGRIAEIADLSPCYFSVQFHHETGYSPMEYHRRRRIEQAKTLLREVDLNIKEIAFQIGFECPFHFSKVFRQITGVSPLAYRRQCLSANIPKE